MFTWVGQLESHLGLTAMRVTSLRTFSASTRQNHSTLVVSKSSVPSGNSKHAHKQHTHLNPFMASISAGPLSASKQSLQTSWSTSYIFLSLPLENQKGIVSLYPIVIGLLSVWSSINFAPTYGRALCNDSCVLSSTVLVQDGFLPAIMSGW